jgi:hypothetical protein
MQIPVHVNFLKKIVNRGKHFESIFKNAVTKFMTHVYIPNSQFLC